MWCQRTKYIKLLSNPTHIIYIYRYAPIVPHPRAIFSVLEIGGKTPLAQRYTRLSMAWTNPSNVRRCSSWWLLWCDDDDGALSGLRLWVKDVREAGPPPRVVRRRDDEVVLRVVVESMIIYYCLGSLYQWIIFFATKLWKQEAESIGICFWWQSVMQKDSEDISDASHLGFFVLTPLFFFGGCLRLWAVGVRYGCFWFCQLSSWVVEWGYVM